MSLHILQPEQGNAWMDVLKRSYQHDFYYLPRYHRLAEQRGEGAARMFVYTAGKYLIALPLLVRPLSQIAGLEAEGQGWWDATSVYGYTGPIASHRDIPEPVLREFRSSLWRTLHDQRIVAVFSRMHPLIPTQRELLHTIGDYVTRWQTVSLDLTLSPDAQLAGYRQGHRYDVKKLRRLGVECLHDPSFTHLETFIDIYHETMRRVHASGSYFFDQSYFERLIEIGDQFHLFVGRQDGRIICGALFALCDGVAQYHLAGTRDDALRLAPMKLVLDEARLWATQQGAHTLHLGGGLSAQEDPLFQFKAGFSDRRHEFAIWRWILNQQVYDRLARIRDEANRRNGLRPASPDFFPQYRCPAVPDTAAEEPVKN